jgi:preprotein translocase subunit SecE
MNKVKAYLQEVYTELMHKVAWPTWAELQNSAVLVMIASFMLSVVVALMDTSFKNLMKLIYSMFY